MISDINILSPDDTFNFNNNENYSEDDINNLDNSSNFEGLYNNKIALNSDSNDNVNKDGKCYSENLSTNWTNKMANNYNFDNCGSGNQYSMDISSSFNSKTGINYIFCLEGENWDFEDTLNLNFDPKQEVNDINDYEIFKKFVDTFFEEQKSSSEDSRSKLKKKKNTKNIQKWLSSVENV